MSDIVIVVGLFLLVMVLFALQSPADEREQSDVADRADMLLELRHMDESKIVSTANSEYEKWREK